MPARKPKPEAIEADPIEAEPEIDRGPGPDQATTIASRWDQKGTR